MEIDWSDLDKSHKETVSGSSEKEKDNWSEFVKWLSLEDNLAGYHLEDVIGSGSFGQVIAATRITDNVPVAIKFVAKYFVKDFIKINGIQVPVEAYLLHKAQHRHVIKIYDWFTTAHYYVYVMERPQVCEDLSRVLRKRTLTENEARRYFFQILEANFSCEENGVLHRDLKPANILVDMDTDEIKLIDFGLASEVQYEPYNRFQGTRAYMAPEYFRSGWYDGCQATVWALGMILVKMLSPSMAFNKPEHALKMAPRIPENLSPEAKNLIGSMLNVVSINRPTLRQVLKHPWFAMQGSMADSYLSSSVSCSFSSSNANSGHCSVSSYSRSSPITSEGETNESNVDSFVKNYDQETTDFLQGEDSINSAVNLEDVIGHGEVISATGKKDNVPEIDWIDNKSPKETVIGLSGSSAGYHLEDVIGCGSFGQDNVPAGTGLRTNTRSRLSRERRKVIDNKDRMENCKVILSSNTTSGHCSVSSSITSEGETNESKVDTFVKNQENAPDVLQVDLINGRQVPAEAYFLQKAQQRRVVKIYYCFTTNHDYVYVMERLQSHEDSSRVFSKRTFTENEARGYFCQILEANLSCEEAEENGVLHRDLKPASILVDMDTDEIKLIDFGLASEVQYEPYNRFRGSMWYHSSPSVNLPRCTKKARVKEMTSDFRKNSSYKNGRITTLLKRNDKGKSGSQRQIFRKADPLEDVRMSRMWVKRTNFLNPWLLFLIKVSHVIPCLHIYVNKADFSVGLILFVLFG